MTAPALVSVVMPVFNGVRFVAEAIDSILSQTFADFEFIIVDDGSTDGTDDILKSYEKGDSRIRVLRPSREGLIGSLNRGCAFASGKYIARMDADDVSLPNRFERQVQFLEAHPEIAVLGTMAEEIGEDGKRRCLRLMPSGPALVGWQLLFRCSLIHPSVMMRRDVVASLGFYRPEALHCEDYDLWVRVAGKYQLTNLPDVLLRYRKWGSNASTVHFAVSEDNLVKEILRPAIGELLGEDVPVESIRKLREACLYLVGHHLPDAGLSGIGPVVELVQKMRKAYVGRRSPNGAEVREIDRDIGLFALRLAANAHGDPLRTRAKMLGVAARSSPWAVLRETIRMGRRKAGKILKGSG